LADAGGVLRFLRHGEDPHAVHPVRSEIISSAILRATTVEAAMWSRQVEMIKLLDREGIIGDEQRASLACLAVDLHVDEVVEYLAPGGASACQPGQALARVAARTHSAGGGR
jgi:acetamidase/formamidase